MSDDTKDLKFQLDELRNMVFKLTQRVAILEAKCHSHVPDPDQRNELYTTPDIDTVVDHDSLQ